MKIRIRARLVQRYQVSKSNSVTMMSTNMDNVKSCHFNIQTNVAPSIEDDTPDTIRKKHSTNIRKRKCKGTETSRLTN